MVDNSLPLSDVTILDLSDDATVFGARLLAELGADVIRVEDLRGDSMRTRGPFLRGESGAERSLAHLLFNAGKRSIAIDWESAESRAAVLNLAARCDAVLAPLRQSPEMRELLAAIVALPGAPGVVDVVFRRDAPDDAATDLIGTAAGGLLGLNGFPADPPNYPAGELGYKELSLAAAHAALALVTERRLGHVPGRVTVSLQEAVNFTTIQTANANWLHWQNRVPSRNVPLSPFTTYTAADGEWVSFTIHPPNWPRYADWIKRDLATDELDSPDWANGVYRAQHNRELSGFTARLCAKYSRQALIEEGQRRGLLVLPVNSVAQIAADVHLQARGFFKEVSIPQLGTKVTLPRTPFLSTAHASGMAAAPALGADTEAVLRDIVGLAQDEIDARFASGAVAGPRTKVASVARPKAVPIARATPPHQPLKGVRILDFCWAIAGPLATRLLADLGADVIKIESEYRLDPIRQIGVQPPGMSSWNTNGQFNDCNTNKRAMTLNLNTPEGIEIVRKLAATADVVTSNYTPDRLNRWGLGYEALRELKPDIIVANWAVMGTRGPNAGWRSYGSGIVAMCGLSDLTGFPGREPIGLGTLHTDFTVPYFAAVQVMSALLHRERTGEGQYMELSQYEASVHLLDTELVEHLNNGSTPGRNGNRSRRMVPHGVFPALGEDRWLATACRDDGDWGRLQSVPGLDSLGGVSDRFAEVERVEGLLSAWSCTRDRETAAAGLQAAGVPASAMLDLADLLANPATRADYRELPLPSGVTVIVQEQPITWDGERLPIVRAPLWGEHTDEILRVELGYSEEEVAGFAANNVLF